MGFVKSCLGVEVAWEQRKANLSCAKRQAGHPRDTKTGANLIYDLMKTTGTRASDITVVTPYLAQVRI